MKDFKIGDIVRVYGNIDEKCRPGMQPYLRGDKAEIISVVSEDEITVQTLDKFYISEVHPKQCRMLSRRKPCETCSK